MLQYVPFTPLSFHAGNQTSVPNYQLVGVNGAGVGKHWATLTTHLKIQNLKFLTAITFAYPGAVFFPKMSILCLYLRIFTRKRYRYTTYAVMVILTINLIVSWCFCLAICQPFQYNWNKFIHGHCLNQEVIYTWISIPNLITDIAILLLPLPVIYHLKSSRGQKIGLTITLLLGSL